MSTGKDSFFVRYGADKIRTPVGLGVTFGLLLVCAAMMKVMGMMGGILFIILPIGVATMATILLRPLVGVSLALIVGFVSPGLSRYVNAPWGLTIDLFLFLAVLGILFKQNKPKGYWAPLSNGVMIAWTIWMGYIFFELVNPEAHSAVAWFYAMRGIGFYQVLSIMIILMVVKDQNYFNFIINAIIWFSIAGTIWGLRQMIFGVDAAEYHWLYAEEHAKEHVLAGVLRIFSYYSDAGQFGASQAMVFLLTGILLLGPERGPRRILYMVACFSAFIGFAVSGTRGALAVPGAGAIIYLITSKNYRLLTVGFLGIFIIFYTLKFTFAFQGVEQVRRMRTAMNPNDPSLQLRLANQRKFARYLGSRPFGGGIGTAGFWGARFSPNTFLAQTATDSWYVKIWAETGVIGLCIHFGVLAFTLGKSGAILWNIRNKVLKQKIAAFYASIAGIMLASYANQVFGALPTGMIMAVMIPLMFLAPEWDDPPPTDEKK